jgi:hypothetical protein
MPRLIKIAIGCGAIPLMAGTAIYFTWRLTQLDLMMLLGMLNIFVGLALFVVGIGCLIYQKHRELCAGRSVAKRRNAVVAALLLANFPAAAVYGVSAIDVMSRFTVRIVNNSGDTISSVEIQGNGFKDEVGPMRAGDHARFHIRNFGEGGVEFIARQQNRVTQGELSGYATGGEDITLRFLPDGKFDVSDNREVDYLARD